MKVTVAFPNSDKIKNQHRALHNLPFSYSEIGYSAKAFVSGYDNDHNKILLGRGDECWRKAKNAIEEWKHFPKGWTKIAPEKTPIVKDENVLVFFKLFGFWWMNALRIVYTLDTHSQYGFAYGTLTDHVERGEECFWIEKEANGDIYYHIRAFSTPRYWMAKLGYPLARYHQRRFVKQSMKRMKNIANA